MGKALVVEFLKYHDEVLPSSVLALQTLGFSVDVLTTAENWAKDPFVRVKARPNRCLTFSPIHRALLKKGLPNLFLRNYDLVVFNSVEPAILLEVARRFHPRVVALVHNAKLVKQNPAYAQTLTSGQPRLWGLAPFISQGFLGGTDRTLHPYYLNDEPFTPVSGPVRFAVQGNFDYSRRHYDSLVTALAQFRKEGRQGFVVDFVGDVKPEDFDRFSKACREARVENYVGFTKGGLSYAGYFGQLGASTYLLPLIEPGVEVLQAYYRDSASSSVSMAVGLGLVPVMDRTLADLYGLADAAVTHGSGTSLYQAMATALDHGADDLAAKRAALARFRDKALAANVENFRRFLTP